MTNNIKKLITIKSLLVLIIVGLVIGTAWFVYSAKNQDTNNVLNDPSYSKLKIDSDPGGVSMESSQYCDSDKIHKTTPYTCSIPEQEKDITVTAPSQFSKEGKNYVFRTWDGCSESNTSKNICKVKLDSDKSKEIKATYDEITNQKNTSSGPNTGAASKCNGQLIDNGQKCRFVIDFGADRMPGRLTVYAVQTNPLNQLYQEITFTAECSVHDACINEAYGQGQQPTTGKVVSPRIDFTINKPTSITIDTPMTADYGNPVSRFNLSQWVYYPSGTGVSTYYDGLRSEYTRQ